MKLWLNPDFDRHQSRRQYTEIPQTRRLGRYSVEYYGYDNSQYFGIFSWKTGKVINNEVRFYEDDLLIYVTNADRAREMHIILYGDGQTKEGTMYAIYNKDTRSVDIKNFSNELIATTCLGPDMYVAMESIGDDYFLVLTEECCTYSRFLGLVNKSVFFTKNSSMGCSDGKLLAQPSPDGKLLAQPSPDGKLLAQPSPDGKSCYIIKEEDRDTDINMLLQKAQEQFKTEQSQYTKPYNNARIGICIADDYVNNNIMVPIETTNEGLIYACVDIKCHEIKEEYAYNAKNCELVKYKDISDFDEYKYADKDV